MKSTLSGTWQPDIFGGAGIQREPGKDRADDLHRAGAEMRDTGSSDLFDALHTNHVDPLTGKAIEANDSRLLGTKESRTTAAQATQEGVAYCRYCGRITCLFPNVKDCSR